MERAADESSKRATIYFDAELHQALRLKAASTHRSISDLVNEAVRQAIQEDRADLAAFAEREGEPTMTYEELLNDLHDRGKL
ncbi:MAG: CopG family transcriptional regulator [Cyanobacteria bacterium J06648_11]